MWSSFITHSFLTHQQCDYIALIKENPSLITYAVVQMDFARNFSFITQQEIQSAYYSRKQAAIFTIYIKVGVEHRNMVLISDYLSHGTRFVICPQKIITDFLKHEYRNVFTFQTPYLMESLFSLDRYNIHNLAQH